MDKYKALAWTLLGVSVIMAVLSYFLLPDTVITQFSVGGNNVTTMPKWIGILIPFAIGGGGALSSLLMKGDSVNRKKSIVVSVVGIAVFIILLAVNL